jgi:hypothetical protein
MSWSDYTSAKHFGNGIFRPYSDFIADIILMMDNRLANEPDLARFINPLPKRDTLLVIGETISILAISSVAHRHIPLFMTIKWEEFLNVSEQVFAEGNNLSNESSSILVNPGLVSYFEESHLLNNVTILAFPSVYQPKKESNETLVRNQCINSAATLMLEKERNLYEEKLEMDKPKEIFLSHKSADKELVREIAITLTAIGFSPWLDEDKMKAGANLERSIREGFSNSCAAVFFITPNFADEGYLATEIDYALAEKREKGDRFSIITLLIQGENGEVGEVPKMIRQYVWKAVQPVEILRTIIEALPVYLEKVVWKQ